MKITLIETDDLDRDNIYYLYEVETENKHYYVSRSSEELDEEDIDTRDYTNHYNMLKREDFTDRQWEIAKYLFMFLWDSSNGTNTCADPDIYEEDGFTREEMEEFVRWFNEKQPNEVLDFYYEDNEGVEIYWAYFSCFDLTKCNPFEDYTYDKEVEEVSSERFLVVFDNKKLTNNYLIACNDLQSAREYVEKFNSNEKLVKENGKVHIEQETITQKIIR